MANVIQELSNIKAAIYGEEVRGSIHDAIFAMNEESEAAKAAATEAQDSALASAQAAADSASTASTKAAEAAESASMASIKAAEASGKAAEAAASAVEAANVARSTAQTEVAKIVADAPESYDTLKEIADWIGTHTDSAAAMNSAIIDLQKKTGTVDSTVRIESNKITETTVDGVTVTTFLKDGTKDVIVSKNTPNEGDTVFVTTTVINGDVITTTHTTEAKGSNPTDPSDPGTGTGSDLTDPSDPGTGTDPTDPSDPSDPGTGSDPTDPSDPGTGSDPTDPSDPGTGTDPTDPSDPGTGTDPTDPSDPGTGTDPTDPSDPGTGNDPGTGSDPTDPNDPGTGNDPSNPSDPGTGNDPSDPTTTKEDGYVSIAGFMYSSNEMEPNTNNTAKIFTSRSTDRVMLVYATGPITAVSSDTSKFTITSIQNEPDSYGYQHISIHAVDLTSSDLPTLTVTSAETDTHKEASSFCYIEIATENTGGPLVIALIESASGAP